MESIQINGQKIWGPPKDWTGPPPPHGTEIFVKNIPDDVYEDELYYHFSAVGRVYEVRLPVHWTGMNKGYAFIRYTKISEADEAIQRMNMFKIRQGRYLKVERSLDNKRLFLSSVPNDKTGGEIKSDLLTVVENVKTVYVYPALENPALFRGYAFVEFVCHRDAAIAKRILTPDVLFSLFDRKCVAAWANPLPFLSKEILKDISILFVRNIPNVIKNNTIRLAVERLIAPDIVHKVKRLNDFAFLTFKNHAIAEKAMSLMEHNPFILGMKAVHVEWAIPRDLGNSVTSTQDSKRHKDDDFSDVKPEHIKETSESLLNVLEDYKTDHPQFTIQDYTNKSKTEAENFENVKFPPHLPFLQRPISKTDSLKHDTFTQNRKYYLQQYNGMNSDNKQRLMTKFHYPDSEDHYRGMRLRNWLQSLAVTHRPSSCDTSPTSPSAGSSSYLSWNEGWSSGSGMSGGYDARSANPKPFQQLCF